MSKLFKKFKKTKLFKNIQKTIPYRAARKVYRTVRKKYANFYRFYTLKCLYPRIYRKASKEEIKQNKVVFIEVRMPEISNSFSYLYEKINSDPKYEVHVHYLRMSFAKRKEYMKRCIDMLKDIGDAKYVFMNESSNVIACIPLRKETKITQVWHGCGAFKKFGLSTADLKFGDDAKTLAKYPYHKNYSYVTVSAPEVRWAYEEAMGLEKGVAVATGISRTDYFFDKKNIDAAYEKLYELFPSAKGKKVILYAPTFRGRVAKAKTPNVLDIELLNEKFGHEYVLIFKHHPFVKKRTKIPEECTEFAADFTDTMTIDELLCVSDICISDYSSLVFEYSLFEKPMIFLAHDLDDYYDWRGFYYDYVDFVPGPIFGTNEEIIEYIKDLDNTFDKQKVIDFKNKFMCSCDGHATDRIIEMVMN